MTFKMSDSVFMISRNLILGVLTLLFSFHNNGFAELRQGYWQSPEQAIDQLASYAATYCNMDEWKSRAARTREGILSGAELLPPPNQCLRKCSLKPIIHSKRLYEGYSVENVAFESMEGFFVTANLYRPRSGSPRFAGVLCPHGHFTGGRFRANQQKRCAALARMGAVVLSYDMVGWGESDQINHGYSKVLALQTWNSIRAIDFLISLEDVDSKRIAVTGASGGGTQTFLVAAVDHRITVSVPVVMVSAHFFGGDVCESGMPIHVSDNHDTNNADIAAMAAPRPQLIISDGGDWTQYTPTVEFPYIQNVYNLYGARDMVENLHLAAEGHDYGYSKRIGAYSFLAEHLGLSLDTDESSIVVEAEEDMHVFTAEYPRPSYAIEGTVAVKRALKNLKSRAVNCSDITGDGRVNFLDFSEMADGWLETGMWPN